MTSLAPAAMVSALVASFAVVGCTGDSSGGGNGSQSDGTGGRSGGTSGDSGTGARGEGGGSAGRDGEGGEPDGDGGEDDTSTGGAGEAGGSSTGGVAGAGGMSIGGAAGMNIGGGGSSSGSGGIAGLGGNAGGGSGGAAASGSGGKGGCELMVPTCNYVSVINPDTVSLKDEQSSRSIVGHSCYAAGTTVFVSEAVCAYSEVCDIFAAGGPACVSCGDDGRRTLMRTVNGVLTDECEGCRCAGIYALSCFADTTQFGEPYVYLSFQRGAKAFAVNVTVSGQVRPNPTWDITATVSNPTITIAPNGLVEFDIVLDYSFTNDFEMPEIWHIESHVVTHCQP